MSYWGIDFHDEKWNTVQKHFKEMADNGMKFAIIKGPMGLGDTDHAILDAFFALCKQYNVLSGIYGWVDPAYPLDPQLTRFQAMIQVYSPAFVGMDYEQWWGDWNKYFAWLAGKAAETTVPRIDAATISSTGEYYIKHLATYGKPTILYSNLGFINTFAAPALQWAKNYPAWDAGYLTNTKRVFTSWAEYQTAFKALPVHKVSIPGTTLSIWQFMSAWTLPGFEEALDMDVMSEDVFNKLACSVLVPAPEPISVPLVPTMVPINYQLINCNNLNIRPEPDLLKPAIGSVPATTTIKTTVTGYAIKNGWVKISQTDDKWCSLDYLKQV